MRKKLLSLLLVVATFLIAPQIGQALDKSFDSLDLTMNFKDGSLPMKGNAPVISVYGSFQDDSGTEICTELNITKWLKRQYTDENWVDMQETTFQEGYYYKPVFGTCTKGNDTYSVNGNSTTIYVDGVAVDKDSSINNIYNNWIGFNVDGVILISKIYETVVEPVVGNKPSTTMNISTYPAGGFKVNKANIVWLESSDGENFESMAAGDVFKSGKYYKFEVVAGNYLADGFTVFKSLNSSVINTDADITYSTDSYLNNKLINEFVIYGPIYSYKFLDKTGSLVVTAGEIKELSFRIDCDIEQFAGISIGNINLLDEDYTLSKGSTIITLTKKGLSKINKLQAGNYAVKVSFKNGEKSTLGNLTINDSLENPSTSDNIILFIIIGLISLVGLAGIVVYTKKRLSK